MPLSIISDIFELQTELNKSLASDFEGFAVECLGHDNGSVQIVWTGATGGTDGQLIAQASLDGVNWCNLTAVAQYQLVSSAAGCGFYEFTSIGYRYLRIKYVKNTVTGGTISKIMWLLKRRRNG
jgi:hypothetical protein